MPRAPRAFGGSAVAGAGGIGSGGSLNCFRSDDDTEVIRIALDFGLRTGMDLADTARPMLPGTMREPGPARWRVHDVAPDLRVRVVRPMPPLPAALEAEVDRLWHAAQARLGGVLFNGRVFSADVISPSLVCGHWTEYRRIVAQMERHDLHAVLGVRPLAVGGVIMGPDGVVFGRRPVGAVYQPGQWQLPPAGSVDDGAARARGEVDLVHQLLVEMHEELGMTADMVRDPRPLCMVEHAANGVGSHVLDLGIAVDTDLTAAEIRACHARGGNAEYLPLEVVPVQGLAAFVSSRLSTITAQAPVFLARTGLLELRRAA
jgi:hypothetical protein